MSATDLSISIMNYSAKDHLICRSHGNDHVLENRIALFSLGRVTSFKHIILNREWQFKKAGIICYIFCHFFKEDNFCDFVFAFLHINRLLMGWNKWLTEDLP